MRTTRGAPSSLSAASSDSLVFSVQRKSSEKTLDKQVEITQKLIARVLTPGAVSITSAAMEPEEREDKSVFGFVS